MDQITLTEVLDDMRDLIIDMDNIRKRLNNMWKKTNRVTGELVDNKRAREFNRI